MSGAPATSRLYFFDNVRYLVIIWVTLFHVASGLAGHQEFIRDSNTSVVFSVFHAYSVTVMMAIMLVVATALRRQATGKHSSFGKRRPSSATELRVVMHRRAASASRSRPCSVAELRSGRPSASPRSSGRETTGTTRCTPRRLRRCRSRARCWRWAARPSST